MTRAPATSAIRRRMRALLGGALLAVVLSPVPAKAQDSEDRFNVLATREASQARPPEGSGHPLMTPEAILTATANFEQCIASLWPQAAARRVSRRTFELATRGLEPELRIMVLLDSQPEFSKPIWEYLDILVSDDRITTGKEAIAQNRAIFEAVEKAYGVDRYIIAAIWGIESNYGKEIGERPVVRSTATLACIGRRQSYFREEFLSTLEILERDDVPLEHLKGSWAGAFGPTQFMPTSFKRFAVDFDGDGRRNVVESTPDVIASTANNLKLDGWQSGATWGYEVMLPGNFDFLHVDRSIRKMLKEWEVLGVRRVGGKPFPRPGDQGFLLLPAGARGPAFVMVNNFRVLMKYNPAEAYALAIGHLADRIRGGEPLVQPWPRDEPPISRSERIELQQRLAALGHDVGEADGILGARTRAAIRNFQARTGLVPDGFANGKLLERLRRGR